MTTLVESPKVTKPAAAVVAAVAEHDTGGFAASLWRSISFAVLLCLIVCGAYPVAVWGIGQALFPIQANGSLVTKTGEYTTNDADAVGSAILAQNFAAPEYFHPRPSSAGNGFDAANSSSSNLGPLSDKLINGAHNSKKPDGTPDPASDFDGVKDLVAAYRTENSLANTVLIPADAVTRSASGLDPHISPRNAELQKPRVAAARHLSEQAVQVLIDAATTHPALGVLGDPGVNVLMLNLSLDKAAPTTTTAPAKTIP